MKSKKILVSIATLLLTTGAALPVFSNISSVKADSVEQQHGIPLVQNNKIGQGFYSPGQKLSIPNSMLRTDPSTFFNSIKQGAIDTWGNHNFLPSVTAAQAAIESGWGTSGLTAAANNLFGIKGRYNGQYVIFPTQEWIDGHYVTINAEFRKYPNWATSVEDHGNFFTDNPRYHNLLGLTDYKQVANLVQEDGYATDPNYAATIIRVIEQYGLQKWDQEAFNGGHGTNEILGFWQGNLRMKGWSISQDSVNKPYSYLFAMDANTNKELARWQIDRTDRPDVSAAYPNYPGASHSGFDKIISVPDELKGHTIYLVARYSADLHGNYDSIDYVFQNKFTIPVSDSKGSIDKFSQSGNSIHAEGWNIGMYTENKPYRWAFLMDTSNHELARMPITTYNRADVGGLYPQYPNATASGFNVNFPVTNSMKGKKAFVMLRYSSDPKGNSDFVDYWGRENSMTIQ